MAKSNQLIIKPLFSAIQEDETNQLLYQKAIHNNLQKILPKSLHSPANDDVDLLDDQRKALYASLPFLRVHPLKQHLT